MPSFTLTLVSVLLIFAGGFMVGLIPAMHIIRKEVGAITLFRAREDEHQMVCRISISGETVENPKVLYHSKRVVLRVIDRTDEISPV